MSTLIRNGAVAADDFATVADDAPLPEGPVLLSLARWELEKEALSADRRFAVRLPNAFNVLGSSPDLLRAAAIVLEFPGFADGRGYSQAHLLRDRLGYAGEVRATGAAVVRDQIQGMARCGIDAFDLRPDQSAEACLAALRDFSRAYQPGVQADHLPRVRILRSGTANA